MTKPIAQVADVRLKDNLILAALALPIGLVIGAIDYVFGQGLLEISAFRQQHLLYLVPFLALAGLVIVYSYHHYGKSAKKGMGLVFDVGHDKADAIPLVLIPLIILSTWLTHLFGGSAGREGVAVQIGAAVSHYCHRLTAIKNKSQIFLVMGMAAGFAGLFQTPMAAVVFALEVLCLGQLSYSALIPAVVASFTASWTSHQLGLEKFSVPLVDALAMTPTYFVQLILLGVVFGLVGNGFAYLLEKGKQVVAKQLPNPYHRVLLVGVVLSAVLLLFHFGRYTGLGTNLIAAAFDHQPIYSYDWLLKCLLTVVTLSAGFQGGEVTPLFSIGASLGVVLAPLVGLPVPLVAALGYVTVFGSATNTFLAPIFIGIEVFGVANAPAYFIVSAFAYMVSRRHSIYSQQRSVNP
ncbi:voltage-gated chloride channel family protein [Streptococcus phocae]|uniref:Voltage-gated chloride channel protein n=1 Tax=Streptococcus phocae TaxID=119224 RepID=A0A0P6S686_9STRE|nr:voltage-gated chloride channel family protein [Streptococcus phocae]KPJ22662.1 voltage-gated chloride channel protein [Streptococcus phocae]